MRKQVQSLFSQFNSRWCLPGFQMQCGVIDNINHGKTIYIQTLLCCTGHTRPISTSSISWFTCLGNITWIKRDNPFIRNYLIDQLLIKERKSNPIPNWFLKVCSQRGLNRPSCKKLILPLMIKICQRTLTIKSLRDLFNASKTLFPNMLTIKYLTELQTLGIINKKSRNNLLNYLFLRS